MAPMVATSEDVELVHEIVGEAFAGLDASRIARAPRLEVGIMVEVPSAALCAPELAGRVAFFSIGSNDLTQYVMAMDRTNSRLASIADGLHPSVLRAIRATVEGAATAGIPVAVCGEMAGDVMLTRLLLGFGLRQFSMHPANLLEIKQQVLKSELARLEQLANRILRVEDPQKALQLLDKLNA